MPAGRHAQREPIIVSTTDVHALPADAVLNALGSGPEGLADDEVARRLAAHGRNELPETKGQPPFVRFLAQINNALI
jgi:magnesium-transporting ATPase (P-type)